ncbi:DUF4403 family protein [Aquirufa rosea]|uniref:DUF4403 family protein n=1 Tax=Aquirufa rosea TaxID=2509241 RepID=A0A4Q1C237_9BACT|nr:DUF4403 family protein [Aquirufa rosea]RXK52175.1 DUF4403 family protein [Aquirufa rosea]
MRYLLGLFLLVVAFSCRREVVLPDAKPAIFQEKFSQIQPQFMQVDFEISYDTIQKWLSFKPGKTIFQSSNNASFIGFPLQVTLLNSIKIQGNNANGLKFQMPIGFIAEPSLAGFSAGKVNGQMDVSVQAELQSTSANSLSIKQLQYSYSWKEKPSLKVAGFGVNVTSVIDRLLASKQDQFIHQITSQVNQSIHASSLEKMLNNSIRSMPINDFMIHPKVNQIALAQLDLGTSVLTGTAYVNSSLEFSQPMENRNTLSNSVKLISQVPSLTNSSLPFSVDLNWEYLRQMVESQWRKASNQPSLSLSIDRTNKDFVQCEIKGYKGKASTFHFNFIPVLVEDKKVSIRLVSKDLQGLGFPSSLFKKSIIRRLERNLASFSVDPTSFLDMSIWREKGIHVESMDLNLETLQWNQDALHLSGKMLGKWFIKK